MHASTFWGLDGRPIVLSIPSIPLFLSLGRVVRASHRASRRPENFSRRPPERPSILSIPSIPLLGSFFDHSGRLFSHFGT